MATEIDLSSPQARRQAKTDARLREALAGLAGNPSAEPTVAALARAAGVGRNIIYTHHAGVLDGLRALQSQRAGANETTAREADRTRSARSEEHTSELQSLMRISYAVFCLKKKNNQDHTRYSHLKAQH